MLILTPDFLPNVLSTLNDLWAVYDTNGSDAQTDEFRQSARLDKYANSFKSASGTGQNRPWHEPVPDWIAHAKAARRVPS